jgi:hypothetical protein
MLLSKLLSSRLQTFPTLGSAALRAEALMWGDRTRAHPFQGAAKRNQQQFMKHACLCDLG